MTAVMQNQFDAALPDFDKAIELKPDDAYTYKFRGFAEIGLNQWDKAVADFTTAIQKQPDDPQNYDRRAWANRNLKNYDVADSGLHGADRKGPKRCRALGEARRDVHFLAAVREGHRRLPGGAKTKARRL